jgi:hypothetical protein
VPLTLMLGTRMIDDPSHWRQRAQEARAEADKLSDAEVKQTMLEIAAAYERLSAFRPCLHSTPSGATSTTTCPCGLRTSSRLS